MIYYLFAPPHNISIMPHIFLRVFTLTNLSEVSAIFCTSNSTSLTPLEFRPSEGHLNDLTALSNYEIQI